MKRQEAIRLIVNRDIKRLTVDQWLEELDYMMLPFPPKELGHNELPPDLLSEFKNEKILQKLSSMLCEEHHKADLTQEYEAAANEYLIEELRSMNINVDNIEGSPLLLEACPCCGYRTLDERDCCDICMVCWWEDYSQDNENADVITGGPNHGLSLTRARINYLKHGIANPLREDLIKIKHPCNRYVKGRSFELSEDGLTVYESQAGWSSSWDN
ncbi:CPCC family cysteine-rich protein [Dethiosulfatarculus sandiegensis]|uniref:Cysteine-rich CPCC domain-containing protein n=1 Tax=Dethiosulfatarculus sandiegensis TaxID=1429043 RepID=A0A0D2G765_9BACT|nr:CPCC family cysteine-rich protein [Dethiosulfatarculus sandiegensis]KIX10822.1 hypothetical protein X474_26435 [Dethiosulfatarculus sandiegensis]